MPWLAFVFGMIGKGGGGNSGSKWQDVVAGSEDTSFSSSVSLSDICRKNESYDLWFLIISIPSTRNWRGFQLDMWLGSLTKAYKTDVNSMTMVVRSGRKEGRGSKGGKMDGLDGKFLWAVEGVWLVLDP